MAPQDIPIATTNQPISTGVRLASGGLLAGVTSAQITITRSAVAIISVTNAVGMLIGNRPLPGMVENASCPLVVVPGS